MTDEQKREIVNYCDSHLDDTFQTVANHFAVNRWEVLLAYKEAKGWL